MARGGRRVRVGPRMYFSLPLSFVLVNFFVYFFRRHVGGRR